MLHKTNSIQTFHCSTFNTIIPYDMLKSRLRDLVYLCLNYKNDIERYTVLVLGGLHSYSVKEHSHA